MGNLRAEFTAANQEQVYLFWDRLSGAQKAQLESQLSKIDPQSLDTIVARALAQSEHKGEIEPLPASATASMLDASPSEVNAWRQRGLAEVAAGNVAVLLLAGGQGTRLGSSAPKGCYDIGLPSHKSLFQLQAERIRKVSQLAKAPGSIPWYIMTSGPTKAPTEDFFKNHAYFGLNPEDVVFFEQGTLPCLTDDGKIIMETPDKVAVAPDGNGGVYKALDVTGTLADMKKRGIKHVHMYCVDNSLVKVADPVFIGFAASRGAELATKVVRKRSTEESVGLIVEKNGAPAVIEYSEISPELAKELDEHNPELLKFRAANIVNHYYSLEFLLKCPELAKKLPFHVARKKIPYADPSSGKTVKPSKANGIKLEQFVFDIFADVPLNKFVCLEVARQDEFSPVKNGPGTADDSPETACRDVLNEGQRWLSLAGVPSGPIEISPALSYAGEGLENIDPRKIAASYIG